MQQSDKQLSDLKQSLESHDSLLVSLRAEQSELKAKLDQAEVWVFLISVGWPRGLAVMNREQIAASVRRSANPKLRFRYFSRTPTNTENELGLVQYISIQKISLFNINLRFNY